MKRMILSLMILILGAASARAQIHPAEDVRGYYKCTFVIGADATFVVKKCN